ncbi:MAG: hypothetical protein LBB83_00890 [Treponema sp.]|jgi:hypothetical protein|nr:hypothetical protein [Treponema sp.]
MKKNRFFILGMTALLAFGLVFVSCGGGNPKALAKQSYEISQEALGAIFNPQKAAELEKKAAAVEKKVAKLSESDKAVYVGELARLSGQGLGNLLDAASKLSDDASLENAQKALDTAQKAVDTAQKAGDLLKSFEN